jgi:PAS domain S-box-containing protein
MSDPIDPDRSRSATSIPLGAAPLEAIVCTDELHRRSTRKPNYAAENQALVALSSVLADSPHQILQTLADRVLEVLKADSAGLSLLTKDGKRFYWAAISGAWKPHAGGGTPRDFGPCGDVLDRNSPILFTHWEERYPYLSKATPLADEGLLVPFYINRKAVGTIWAIAHNDQRKFDAEDLRLLESLGRFASAAYQSLATIEALRVENVARQDAEAELRRWADRLESKTRCLVDANIMGLFVWNLDGRILEANDAFLKMVGYDREEVASGRLRWPDLTPAEWRLRDQEALAELRSVGTVQPYEKEYLRKQGDRVTVWVGAAVFERGGEDGVAFVLDLTARKKAEQAARDSERRQSEVEIQLAHANRITTMGHLSASLAHEVNQPISATIIDAQTALRRLNVDQPDVDSVRQLLDRIVKNVYRASNVVARIRRYVTNAPPQKETFEINPAIEEIITLVHRELQKNSIEIETRLDADLSAIQADRVQIQQVILNLIINAVEALSTTVDGQRIVSVKTYRPGAGWISISVSDSGPGLTEALQEHVFEPFYTTKSGGMGMGLAICRSIIEAHGGKLTVSANAPTGAAFTVALPSEIQTESRV